MDIRNCALAFAAGVVVAHWLPAAQPLWLCWLAGGAGLLPLRRLRVAGMLALGLGWGALHALDAMARRIDASCAAITVVGRIVDLPARSEAGPRADGLSMQRFVLAPETSDCGIPGRVRLTWFDGPRLRGGERWRMSVRLKPPRGTANAYGFDADRWFARTRLAATGYVVSGSRLDAAADAATLLDTVRENLRDRLLRLDLVHGGVLAALTLGDSAAIPNEALERYRRTGTMHLLVISGLHVGIVTALGFLLGRGLGLLCGLPAKPAGVVAALLLAGGYVLLAGAGLSLLRAFAMSATAMLALVVGRSTSPSAVFAYALAVVLLLDAMAPLAAGFWLSFGAVAVLLGFFAPRPRPRSWVASAVVAQLAIAVVFVPAAVGITGLIHPFGIAVNLVAVPAVTLLVVPLALVGTMLLGTPIGPWLLLGADFGVAVVAEVLAFADRLAPLYVADPGWWLPWVAAAAAACLLPVSRLAALALAAAVAALLLVPSLLPKPAVLPGEVAVTVLDVGQGTAVLVETASHALLYDAGPGFPAGADAGDSVVLPALRGRGRNAIDMLVLSHGDLDHVGGAASVLAGIRVGAVLAGEPVAGFGAAPCQAGMRWRWDGVDFVVLNPLPGHGFAGNNASCVLLIETATARVLLPGDIEKTVEADLRVPAVDLLLVPHHGSATSSTAAFVAALRPTFAVVGAGFENRFGHPHPAVVERYRNVGAHILSTGVSGALRWRSDHPHAIAATRCRDSPYWRLDGGGLPVRRALDAGLAACGPI